jgi:hypothetical protein
MGATRAVIRDCLFLSLAVVLSFSGYVLQLGFYLDDWIHLGLMTTASDDSFSGLLWLMYSWAPVRPVHMLYTVGLYWLFGLHPTGYHLINGVVLVACTLLFYLVLRALDQPRILAVTVPLVYSLLPHYSTNRFWFAAFMIPLSIALFFLSVYADLRLLEARGRAIPGWKGLSLLSVILSGLAYEVAVPLFLLNPLLVWYRARTMENSLERQPLTRLHWAFLVGSHMLALGVLIAFKGYATLTIPLYPMMFGPTGNQIGLTEYILSILERAVSFSYLHEWIFNIWKVLLIAFGDFGLRLPTIALQVLREYLEWDTVVMSAILGMLLWGYLYSLLHQAGGELPGPSRMLACASMGLGVFGLGYAIFLPAGDIQFIMLIDDWNRTAMAAAIGVALSLVGTLGWSSALIRRGWVRRGLFATLVTCLCVSNFLINNAVATFWSRANREQQAILAAIKERFPTLPSEGTLLLDGVCPVVGPAFVFFFGYDFTWALRIHYGDAAIRGDVIKRHLAIEEDGLSTRLNIPGLEPDAFGDKYPYGTVTIFNPYRGVVHPVSDAREAARYFEQYNPNYQNACPDEVGGVGVSIWNQDRKRVEGSG